MDAVPLDAQVFLDDRLLGSAHALAARALPVAPGRHTILIVAPGYRGYRAEFTVAPGGLHIRVRARLSAQ